MIYIPLSFSLSLSLPFRERNPDVGLRSGRFVKATTAAMPRPQIHDHCNVSRCQSSCINIIRWPSFNYGGVAISLFGTTLFGPGTVFVCFNSIQSGYYRTRCTPAPTYRFVAMDLHFTRRPLSSMYISWFSSDEERKSGLRWINFGLIKIFIEIGSHFFLLYFWIGRREVCVLIWSA